jgi:hypothetical protein
MRLSKASRCVNCNKLLDAATVTNKKDDVIPREGNITVCMYCGHVMVFGRGLALRDPTGVEIVEMAGCSELVRAQAMREYITKNRKKRT